jgi:hypothetical protein
MGISFTMREEQKCWLFENKVLQKIFGPKMDISWLFQNKVLGQIFGLKMNITLGETS